MIHILLLILIKIFSNLKKHSGFYTGNNSRFDEYFFEPCNLVKLRG